MKIVGDNEIFQFNRNVRLREKVGLSANFTLTYNVQWFHPEIITLEFLSSDTNSILKMNIFRNENKINHDIVRF